VAIQVEFTGDAEGLGEELSADLQAAINDYEQEFLWDNTPFPCVINFQTSTLTVAKALFIGGIYPEFGDEITVAGKTFQVKAINSSEGFLTAGGIVEDRPLMLDDPASAVLIIEFGKFITK
jgi:hypothetical protein